MFEQHLTKALTLSATQQNTVHTVLAERHVATKGFPQQMQSLHSQMVAAIKSGNSSQIESITQQMGSLHQQEQTAHATAISKIYQSLTPEQKTKVGQNLEMLMRGGFGGPGFGPGRRGGPPPNAPTSTSSSAQPNAKQ